MARQLALPFLSPTARRSDPDTSHEAARAIAPKLGRIQVEVVAVFRAFGPMTARDAEALRELEAYGFSTVRKRVSELAKAGVLRDTGRRNGSPPAIVYELTEAWR